MEYFLNKILPLLITGIVTYFATYMLSKKSQLTKLIDQIHKLSRQLGVKDGKTINDEIIEVSKCMGTSLDSKTLTGQHIDIQKLIENAFSQIKSRYEKEDDSYRYFTMQQKDIKDTVDNFSKDYARLISENRSLHMELQKALAEKESLQKLTKELTNKLEYRTNSNLNFQEEMEGGDREEDELEL
ncbi:hypothetical protein Osc1_23910 [Hominimerdicola sp. 21CYCFAH17_S]